MIAPEWKHYLAAEHGAGGGVAAGGQVQLDKLLAVCAQRVVWLGHGQSAGERVRNNAANGDVNHTVVVAHQMKEPNLGRVRHIGVIVHNLMHADASRNRRTAGGVVLKLRAHSRKGVIREEIEIKRVERDGGVVAVLQHGDVHVLAVHNNYTFKYSDEYFIQAC